MIRRVGILLVALALLQIAGGHWLSLQLVAWGRMLIDYSQSNGLAAGIRMTFDAEHPCPMCKRIAKAQETERQQQQRTPAIDDVKPLVLGLPPVHRYTVPTANNLFPGTPQPASAFKSRSDQPPVPPPRLFRAV